MRLAGYRAGGISRYARELCVALARLPSLDVTPLRSRRDVSHDVGGRRLWTPPHHRFETVAIGLELRLRRVHADVYHATDFIAPWLPGTPAVATVHDLAFEDRPHDLTPDALAYYRRLDAATRRTTRWITPSRWTANALVARHAVAPGRVHVIPHGAPPELIDRSLVPRADRGNYVIAIGTVEPRKNYSLLLDAYAAQPMLPRLLVVGPAGWNADETERRLRATPGVEWRRDVDDAEARELLRGALALVLPSHAEGFGLSALEAMAAGTPVLSSAQGALLETTGDAALAVAGFAGAWSAAIAELAADAERWRRLVAAGRARAREFSWDRAAHETANVYALAAGGRA